VFSADDRASSRNLVGNCCCGQTVPWWGEGSSPLLGTKLKAPAGGLFDLAPRRGRPPVGGHLISDADYPGLGGGKFKSSPGHQTYRPPLGAYFFGAQERAREAPLREDLTLALCFGSLWGAPVLAVAYKISPPATLWQGFYANATNYAAAAAMASTAATTMIVSHSLGGAVLESSAPRRRKKRRESSLSRSVGMGAYTVRPRLNLVACSGLIVVYTGK